MHRSTQRRPREPVTRLNGADLDRDSAGRESEDTEPARHTTTARANIPEPARRSPASRRPQRIVRDAARSPGSDPIWTRWTDATLMRLTASADDVELVGHTVRSCDHLKRPSGSTNIELGRRRALRDRHAGTPIVSRRSGPEREDAVLTDPIVDLDPARLD